MTKKSTIIELVLNLFLHVELKEIGTKSSQLEPAPEPQHVTAPRLPKNDAAPAPQHWLEFECLQQLKKSPPAPIS
jgi:hypothetical protein